MTVCELLKDDAKKPQKMEQRHLMDKKTSKTSKEITHQKKFIMKF